MSPVLEITDVSKSYPGSPPVTALAAVALEIHAAERAAVLGPSGSGKTTLLHVAGALERPSRGSVRIGGREVSARYPAVVLGAVAARTLGIDRVRPDTQVYLADRYFTVIGILRPVPLAPEIDEAALVGFPAADSLLGLGGRPTEIYLRAVPDQVQPVTSVLPFTANPAEPEGVQVSLPSSILAARAAARTLYPAVRAARLAPAEALRAS